MLRCKFPSSVFLRLDDWFTMNCGCTPFDVATLTDKWTPGLDGEALARRSMSYGCRVASGIFASSSLSLTGICMEFVWGANRERGSRCLH
jgi:hypothetical protein